VEGANPFEQEPVQLNNVVIITSSWSFPVHAASNHQPLTRTFPDFRFFDTIAETVARLRGDSSWQDPQRNQAEGGKV
jgi:hypothetical protein